MQLPKLSAVLWRPPNFPRIPDETRVVDPTERANTICECLIRLARSSQGLAGSVIRCTVRCAREGGGGSKEGMGSLLSSRYGVGGARGVSMQGDVCGQSFSPPEVDKSYSCHVACKTTRVRQRLRSLRKPPPETDGVEDICPWRMVHTFSWYFSVPTKAHQGIYVSVFSYHYRDKFRQNQQN